MKPTLRATVFVAAALCAARPLLAQQQDPPRGGYPVVFGAVDGRDAAANKRLDLSVDFAEAYDDNLLADVGGVAPSSLLQESGLYTMLVPQATLDLRGERLQFSARGASNLHYYDSVHRVVVINQNVGAGLSATLTRSTTVLVNQAVGYAPAYLYALLAPAAAPRIGDTVASAPDFQTDSARSYTYATNAGLTHAFSDRASLSFSGTYQATNFVGGGPAYVDLHSYDAGGRWSYQLTRDAKLRLGYTYRQAMYSARMRPTEHEIEIGVDYTRPLSATRKSVVGFSVGPTVVTGPLAVRELEPATARYRLVGDAFLEHHMGRTWHARAGYHRGIAYIGGLAGPVYTDAANAETGGFLSRRIDVLFSTSYALGDMAARSTSAAQFTTYAADARLRYGLSRDLAAYVEGLFYSYAFDRSLLTLPGLPDHFKRAGVRAGLTVWVPVRSR